MVVLFANGSQLLPASLLKNSNIPAEAFTDWLGLTALLCVMLSGIEQSSRTIEQNSRTIEQNSGTIEQNNK